MVTKLISIDWFQVTCKATKKTDWQAGIYFHGTMLNDDGNNNLYHLDQPREFNALFNDCYSVMMHNFPIATVYMHPRPTTLDTNLCMLKLYNPLLYTAKWLWYLNDVMGGLGWTFHNITRIDLSCDFNEFEGHLDPREFIRRYLMGGNVHDGYERYWRVGGNKSYSVNDKRIYCNDTGKFSSVVTDCEYLRFGSRSSGVATYLYNKTKELNDKGGKQYIRDLWAKMGLTDTPEHPVYRLEFSIAPSAMTIKRKLTDEEKQEMSKADDIIDATLKHWQLRTLCLDDFSTQESVERLWWCYFQHYFRFKIIGTQKYPHNWQDKELFEMDLNYTLKPYCVHAKRDSGVAEANAAKRIAQLIEETPMTIADKLAMNRTAELLARIADVKQVTINPDDGIKFCDMLMEGCDFDTIIKSGMMPKNTAVRLQTYVQSCIKRDVAAIRDYIQSDMAVITYYDDIEQAKNHIIAEKGYWGLEETTLPTYTRDYESEIARRNKRCQDDFTKDYCPY